MKGKSENNCSFSWESTIVITYVQTNWLLSDKVSVVDHKCVLKSKSLVNWAYCLLLKDETIKHWQKHVALAVKVEILKREKPLVSNDKQDEI